MDAIDQLSLETAAYDGNMEIIKNAVETGRLLSYPEVLMRIIEIAFGENQFSVLNYLSSVGVSFLRPNGYGVTPLAGAVWGANVEAVKYLLKKAYPLANLIVKENHSYLLR